MAKKKLEESEISVSRLEDVLSKFDKLNNSGADLILLGDDPINKIPTVSWGSLLIDKASGVGGAPYGRIIEVMGLESGGKTTLTLSLIAEAQKKGGIGAFIDAEHALSLSMAEGVGVDVHSLLLSQPDYGEQALTVAENLASILGQGDVIVIDSVAALTPKAEIDGTMEDNHVGLQARMMGQGLRKLTAKVAKSGVIIVFINQIREKIGIIYGPKETTPGGKSLAFYASQRLDVRKIGIIKDKTDAVIANKVRVKFVKNKVASPFREAETIIRFGDGIPKDHEVLLCGVELGLIEKAGSWYRYNGEGIGQGDQKACEFLKSNPKVLSELEKKIRKEYNIL